MTTVETLGWEGGSKKDKKVWKKPPLEGKEEKGGQKDQITSLHCRLTLTLFKSTQTPPFCKREGGRAGRSRIEGGRNENVKKREGKSQQEH